MSNNLLLSVITINLNNKKGLQETIESLLNQTFNDYEFIVIDGASTDGSVEIIKQNKASIDYWVSEKDKGVYSAMNKGIKQAKGKYCYFLNSGDVLLDKQTLQNISKFFSEDIDILYGNAMRSGTNNKMYQCVIADKLTLYTHYQRPLIHQAMFIKTNLFDQFGLYNEQYKIASDLEFNIKTLVLNACSYKHVGLPIVFYDDTGISNTNKELTQKERWQILKTFFPNTVLEDYKRLSHLETKQLVTHPFGDLSKALLKKVILFPSFFIKKRKAT